MKEVFQMGREMRSYTVGPMPAQQFLDRFFPMSELEGYAEKAFQKGTFRKMVGCKNETSAYGPFVSKLAS